MTRGVSEITGPVLCAIYRRAMRQAALLVRDIDVARRAGCPAPGDTGLRVTALRTAMGWRDRANQAWRRSL